MVKGVLLCGGEGTRLHPLTLVANKHLQRIGRKVMVDYPFEKLIEAGIAQIHVIVGGEHWPPVIKYLGSGHERGVDISYSIQDRPGGIAEAVSLARTFAGEDKVCVVLGDNLFDMSLRPWVKYFGASEKDSEAVLFSKRVKDPQRFGVLLRSSEDSSQPVDIIEKPSDPPSDEILTGVYMFTPDVFDIIKTCRPSERGELEITDVNRKYIQKGVTTVVQMEGRWTDCGTFETLQQAERMVSEWNGADGERLPRTAQGVDSGKQPDRGG